MEIIKCEKCFYLQGQHLSPDCCGGINEIWKDIIGYEGKYQCSSLGRIKSLKRYDRRSDKILGGGINSRGYVNYNFIKIQGHRIVAMAFIPNSENKPQVNHKNGIKTDNRVENLEWVTRSENLIHAHNTGLKNGMERESHPMTKITKRDIEEIKKLKEVMTTREMAIKYNVSKSTIDRAKRLPITERFKE